MDISRSKDILDYWFSKGLYTPDYDKWFIKSQDYDEEIKEKFGGLLKEAEQGKGFGWLHTKDSYVAYIILLDQFSRHIYRGSGDSFKNDTGVMIFTELGFELYNMFPEYFIPEYIMISFTNIPYSVAKKRSHIQDKILDEILAHKKTFEKETFEKIVKENLSKLEYEKNS